MKQSPSILHCAVLQIGKNQSKAAMCDIGEDISVHTIVKGSSPTNALEQLNLPKKPAHLILGFTDDNFDRSTIKEIATQHLLTPVGFVVIHEAIAHMLKLEHDIPQTALFVCLEPDQISISLYRVGICKQTARVPRTNSLFEDFEKALESYTREEILPSKLILYNEGSSLSDIREQLLSYPWQDNEQFLHVPKIDALPWEYSIRAVAYSGGRELQQHTIPVPIANIVTNPPVEESDSDIDSVMDDKNEPLYAIEKSGQTTSSPTIMGFKQDTDVRETATYETPIKTATISPTAPRYKFSLPMIRPPHALMLPKARALMVISTALVLVFMAIGASAYWYPKVTLSLLAQPKILEEEIQFTIATDQTEVDIAKKQIPGQIHAVKVTGSKIADATGTKTIGEKASGTITIYNESTDEITIKKGTILGTSSKLSFTLDDTVTIASASTTLIDGGKTINYGKANARITAKEIGPESNLKKDTEFSLDNTPTSTLLGKNELPLSGGTEREITIFSDNDKDEVLASLTKELKDQAQEELHGQVLGTESYVPESLSANTIDVTFDKDVGDETDSATLDLALEVSQISYEKESIDAFLKDYISDKIPAGYEIDTNRSFFTIIDSITDPEDPKESRTLFTANYTAYLLPDIKSDTYGESLRGKSIHDLDAFVSTLADKNIIGYELEYERRLPFMSYLPFRSDNITVQVMPY